MYAHRQTSGGVDNPVRHESLTSGWASGRHKKKQQPHKHVTLSARVWSALLKVNRDLKPLKLHLNLWEPELSWLVRLSVYPDAAHTPSERYRLWALTAEK